MQRGGGGGSGGSGGLLSSCLGPCLANALATTWVDFFNATMLSRRALEEENEMIRMGAVHKDLDATYQRLLNREIELDAKAEFLAKQAVMARRQGKMELAKRKMQERARVIASADKIRNSASLIDMHRSTIEDSNLDVEVLQTLKASNAALREKGVSTEGVQAVDSIIADAQSNLQSASEITGALSTSFSDAISTVLIDGRPVGEDDLMRELDDMLLGNEHDDDEEEQHQQHQQQEEGAWGTVRPGEAPPTATAKKMHRNSSSKTLPLMDRRMPVPPPLAQTVAAAPRRTLLPAPPTSEKEEEEEDEGAAYASPFMSVPLQSARRKMMLAE